MGLSPEDFAKLTPWEKVKAHQELEKYKKKNKKFGAGSLGMFKIAGEDQGQRKTKKSKRKNNRTPLSEMTKNQRKRFKRKREG